MDLIWRALEEHDAGTVVALELALFGGEAWHAVAVREELANPERVYLGAFQAGRMVAYGGVSLLPDADIMTIAVVPDMRGRGLARELLRQLVEAARNNDCERVFLEVRASNKVAIHLYEATGFMRVGVRRNYYQRPREDALVMRMLLRESA